MPSSAETRSRRKSRTGPSAGTGFPTGPVFHVVKSFLICLIILSCFFLANAHPAWSQVATDEYIAGFATAVLRHEFKATDSTLQVHNGVVRVNVRSLGGLDREKVKRALAGIAGVKDVVLVEDEDIASAPPSARGIRVDIPETESSFLPRGLLFAPLHADPRWPHFSAAYRGYRTNNLTATFGGNFGETFSIYRNRAPLNGQWEFVIQAGLFSLFNLNSTSFNLINADYTVGALATYRSGHFSSFLRLHHQSSHLGDEFLLTNPGVRRINLSYEEVDLKLSYELSEWVRMYGGGGYLVHRDPADVKPVSTEWGLELASPLSFFDGSIRPVCYADFQVNERAHWSVAQSVMAGLRFENARIGNRQLQLLAEYFAGPSPNGQFYVRHEHWFGIGLHFYF